MWNNLARGPEFADEMDDCLQYSMRISASACVVYGIGDYPPFIHEVDNMDLIFHPHLLIPFERPPSNDIHYLFEEKPPLKQELLDRFEQKMSEYLLYTNRKPFVPDDLLRLQLMGSQTVYSASDNARIKKSVARGLDPELRLTTEWKFDSVEVTKRPSESRDSVVADLDTACTLQVIRKQIEQVINVPSDIIGNKDMSFIPEWASAISKRLYLMSDQKKCGLTFPRQLLIKFFEVLNREFPEYSFNYAVEGLRNTMVRDHTDGIWKRATGGPGLGQLSEAMSAIVAIVFEVWKENQDPELDLEGLFYGDDQVIRFTADFNRLADPPPWVLDLAQDWDKWMEAFGMSVHTKKPFISMGGLLLEIYGEGFPVKTPKTIQWVGNIFYSLCQPNIVAAKEYFANMMDIIYPDEHHFCLEILNKVIIPYWGYEFFPQEVDLPYQLGGWYRRRSEEGLDEVLLYVSNIPTEHRGLVNLLGLNRPEKDSTRLTGERARQYKFVKQTVDSLVDSAPPLLSYKTMAKAALKASRLSGVVRVQIYEKWARQRMKAYSRKPRTITSRLYWDTCFEAGRLIAAPFEMYEEKGYAPFRRVTYDVGKPMTQSDPVRSYLRLAQEFGELSKDLYFYEEFGPTTSVEAEYQFLRSLNSPFVLSPLSVKILALFGVRSITRYEDYYTRLGREAYFPPLPEDILPLIDKVFGCMDTSFVLIHTIRHWIPSGLESYVDFEPDFVVKQAYRFMTDMFYKVYGDGTPIPNFEGFVETLEETARPLEVADSEPPGPGIVPDEEEKLMVAYLLDQIAVANTVSAEIVMRDAVLRDQIYGDDDVPDAFEDEDDEGMLDMFG
jgi:hypothetical protein